MKNIFKTTSKIIKGLLIVLTVYLSGGVSGQKEIIVVNDNLNKTLNLSAMAEVIEAINYNDLYAPLDTYVGYLTGYAADCPLCSGFLGCTNKDVRDRTTTYADKDYGTVKIVASSKKIPCGSIIQFETKRVSDEPVLAIVLDRGVGGTAIDLLTHSEEYARNNIGRTQIKYDILRKGWEKKSE